MFKLNYCIKCNESSKYSYKKENKCKVCKSTLKYKCGKCAKLFETSSSMQAHIARFCNKERKFCCDLCDYRAHDKSTLATHMKGKHLPRDPNANKCNKCAKSFSTKHVLKTHSKNCGLPQHLVRWHSNCKTLFCDSCQYQTPVKTKLARHIQAKHLKRDYKINHCNKCGKNYFLLSSLQRHSYVCSSSKDPIRYSCDSCEFTTVHRESLSSHMKAKHLPRDPNANKCSHCKKTYSSKSKLLRHAKICDKNIESFLQVKLISCDHCNFRTRHKESIVGHMKAKHIPKDSNLNKCSHCEKKFTTHSGLSQHIRATHLPWDPNLNRCNKCKKGFTRLSNLNTHSKICGLSETAKLSLKRFSCDYCESKFLVKSKLAEHIQAKHLPRNRNLNKCKNCKKSYSCPSSLRTHTKICGLSKDLKHSLKRFACEHCDFITHCKNNLSNHIQAKHLL